MTVLGQLAAQSVMVFFVISGMLITQSILKNIERHKSFDLVEYGISRLARIYPPLLFSIAICGAIYWIVHALHLPGHAANFPLNLGPFPPSREVISTSRRDVLEAVIMRNGLLDMNGPLWSLCIEWRIYMVAGFLAFALTARRWWLKVIGTIACYVAATKLMAFSEHAIFYLIVWAIGAFWTIFGHFLGVVKTGIVMMATLGLAAIWAAIDPSVLTAGGLRFGIAESVFQFDICLFWCTVLSNRPVHSHIPRRIMEWLGGVSYSLYILHFPILLFSLSLLMQQNLIAGSPRKSTAGALAAIAMAVIVSYLSARLFERKTTFEAAIYRLVGKIHWLKSNRPGIRADT